MTKVCVIFGGASSEHEVSLRSASCILNNIDRSKYEVIMVGITKEGNWYHYTGATELIETGQWEHSEFLESALLSPNPADSGIILMGDVMTPSKKVRQKLVAESTPVKEQQTANKLRVIPVDVIFPVLHGTNGEDGTIQGLFELTGIPYVGCGVLASAACMDKGIAHVILESVGVPKTKLITVLNSHMEDFDELTSRLEEALGYPMFVKPANQGSSVGITKVKAREELLEAINHAFEYDSKVVVEQAVVGREVECAIWGNEKPHASHTIGEIIPSRDFYDYEGKYLDDSAGLVAPADLKKEIIEKLREAAVLAYSAMGCRGLARVDFFVREDESIVLNEINTLPGFTSISMYPRLFVEDGISIEKQIDNLIDSAFSR